MRITIHLPAVGGCRGLGNSFVIGLRCQQGFNVTTPLAATTRYNLPGASLSTLAVYQFRKTLAGSFP
jgi:hypothetical protein